MCQPFLDCVAARDSMMMKTHSRRENLKTLVEHTLSLPLAFIISIVNVAYSSC